MTCGSLFGPIYDMWLTFTLSSIRTNLWHVALCLAKSMTHDSLWTCVVFGPIDDNLIAVTLWFNWTVYEMWLNATITILAETGKSWNWILITLIFGWVRVKKMFFSSSNSKNRKQFGVVHKSNVVELFSLSMSRIYLRNAQAMPKICPRCPQYIIKIFPKYSQDLP